MIELRAELSLALAGLSLPAPQTLREQLVHAAELGFRAVHLNAAAPDARPRDLGRTARRDIASLLRRSELSLSGVDLWIPAPDYLDAARSSRAVEAAAEAIDFAADLAELTSGRAVLCLTLPADAPGASAVVSELATHAERRGVRLADHQWPVIWAAPGGSLPALHAGIDPASLLIAGADPSAEVSRLGPHLACLRLSDLGPGGRVPAGSGRLDTTSYLVACSLQAHAGPLVVDVRGLADPSKAARSAQRRFGR